MKIIALYVGQLTNPKHFSFIQFVLAACGQFSIIGALFPKQLAALQAAFEHENAVYLKHNRSFLTPEVNEKENDRDKAFRALRDLLKALILTNNPERVQKAEFLLGIIKDYGGASITAMAVDAESGVLTNLCEDLLEKYKADVEALGIKSLVEDLKAANEAYIKISADRTLDESKSEKAAMTKARRETDIAYRGFVNFVNGHIQYEGIGELLPFVKYLNTEIERYRIQLGIGTGNPDWGGDEELDDPADGETTTPPTNKPETPPSSGSGSSSGSGDKDEDYGII